MIGCSVLVMLTAVIQARLKLTWLANAHDRLATYFVIAVPVLAHWIFIMLKPFPVGWLIDITKPGSVCNRIIKVRFDTLIRQGYMPYPGVIGNQEYRLLFQVPHN